MVTVNGLPGYSSETPVRFLLLSSAKDLRIRINFFFRPTTSKEVTRSMVAIIWKTYERLIPDIFFFFPALRWLDRFSSTASKHGLHKLHAMLANLKICKRPRLEWPPGLRCYPTWTVFERLTYRFRSFVPFDLYGMDFPLEFYLLIWIPKTVQLCIVR